MHKPGRHRLANALTAMARILIAEDESMLCDMCASALADDGHEVETAHDGSAALDVLNERGGRFDLLLTDVSMPRMDGIALSLAAARDFPEITILLMTGHAGQRERAFGLDALVHDVLAKPFTVASLCGAVNEALADKARR
jgi:two-component system, cell cycle response regulator CpdR